MIVNKRWKYSKTCVHNVRLCENLIFCEFSTPFFDLIGIYYLFFMETCVFTQPDVAYHLIWCPKYRRKILIDTITKDLRELLKLKAKELDIEIEDMKVMPDHVDLFVNANPTAAPHWIV
ncbi:transposase IS200 like protein [archaeon]|nr:transposase IS200 like protein [archaeon]